MIEFDEQGTKEGLQRIISRAAARSCEKGGAVMVLACDANEFTPRGIDDILQSSPVPLFGGVFPKIIYQGHLLETGSLAVSFPGAAKTLFIPDLSDSEADYEAIMDAALPETDTARTLVVFPDGFSKRIGAFIESLFNIFGLEINYIGGGAGSMSMCKKPCLLTGEGMKSDGAVLAFLEMESGVGVSHGWELLNGPFRVTESDRNTIKTLDWRPAFDVYREIVEPHAGKRFGPDDFFGISKAYPFGILRMGTEQIVRDPFLVEKDGSLVCVGEVPEGSCVNILHGSRSSLIRAAERAATLGRQALRQGLRERLCIFMDCISRVLFLGDRFEQEIEAVVEAGLPMAGACTIGEIANRGDEFLEFYNKTAVVAILGDSS